MDVGANVGDTALLIRLSGCTLPIIAIEASSLFFEIMRRNVSRYPDLFGAIELVHSSVSCGQDNMSLVHGNGTAHLAAVYDVMPGNPESATSIIGLDEIASENVSLLKIDTDGFDAAIINANKNFLEHRQPILWVEADCASDTQLADWQTAMPALVSVYEYVIAFDNFGFAISAGKLTQKTSLLIDLISYCYQHKQMPTAQFGPPRIFYLDICFFPSSRVDEYRTFVSRLPEIQDCMASS